MKIGQDAEQAGECVGDVEDLLLAVLEVFVVGEWLEAFDVGVESAVADRQQPGGFAAGEFGEVGVLLLRHRWEGAGGEGLGELDEVEFRSGVEGDLFGEARDVQAECRGSLCEVEHEVAVRWLRPCC